MSTKVAIPAKNTYLAKIFIKAIQNYIIYKCSWLNVKLSVVIPAYNEEKRIRETLEAYSIYFDGLVSKKEIDSEIVVVINKTTSMCLFNNTTLT